LTRALADTEFLRWYWLKTELVAFCRESGIGTAGSKPELSARISAMLAGTRQPPAATRRVRGPMPARFTPATRIGAGWSCNPALGAFFREQCGRRFRFNKATRDFIHTQEGRPLSAAIACYRASVAEGAPRQELAPQLEYNRHTRAYHEAHPGATREQVIAAWRERRSRPTG
jgi:hypothetical protein